MRYVIEAKETSVDGTIERWLAGDRHDCTQPRVFVSIDQARELASKYRAWSKGWSGKRSFRIIAVMGN